MISSEAVGALTQLLWMSPEDRVYVLLDGASIPNLLDRLYSDRRPEFECLYRGELAPDMAEVAPYLVALDRGSEFSEWVMKHSWGNHCGIFAISQSDLRTVHFHLRKLTIAYSPEGKPRLFRYYDPRVLRVFLPTFDADQVKGMFGPVDRYVAEGEAPELRSHLLKRLESFRLARAGLRANEPNAHNLIVISSYREKRHSSDGSVEAETHK